MVLLVSPAAKVRVSPGRVPPKSAAFTSPDTFQSTVVAWSVSPVRVTVKV